MQLDQTHVTIRARTLSEIGDLAMVLIRSYPLAISVGFVVGALPWAILNMFILASIPINEYSIASYDEDMETNLWSYQFLMAILVFVQIPAAGVLTTVYIGQAIFESRPTWRSVFHETRITFLRWFWSLGVVRGPVPVMLFVALFWEQDYFNELLFVWLITLTIIVLLLRSNRPFMPEILLLERCPLRSKKGSLVITANQRSKALHRPVAGELFGRFLAMTILLTAMAMLGFYSLLWARGILFGMWEWDAIVYVVLYPIALWAAGALSVLIRFLSYLDTRIRLEGWEVQLAVLAETTRQFGDTDQTLVETRRVPSKNVIEGRI